MKFYRNTLISKGVVKHKKRKEGKQRKTKTHYNIYAHAYTRAREKKEEG